MMEKKTLWKSRRTRRRNEEISPAALSNTNNSDDDDQKLASGSAFHSARPGAFPVWALDESNDLEMIQGEEATTTVVVSTPHTVVSADLVDEEAARQRGQALAELERYRNITAVAESVHVGHMMPSSSNAHQNKRKYMAAAACFVILGAVLASVIVVIPLIVLNDHNDENNNADDNRVNSTNSTKQKCFAFKDELQTTLYSYLSIHDNEKESVLAKYGSPIGNWCVSEITSLSNLFSLHFGDWLSPDDYKTLNPNSTLNLDDDNASSTTNQTITLQERITSFNDDLSLWDTSCVTNMSGMFDSASSYNQPMSLWNTSSVTDMSWMFYRGTAYNQPMSLWDTSSVTDMSGMFDSASSYNQPMSFALWNTSSVTYMTGMFSGATSYNQPMSLWNTSSVTYMSWMFGGATSYNQPMSSWNTSSVIDMSGMFYVAESFNHHLNTWDVSNVAYMKSMFENAISFDQDISGWHVAKITDLSFMFAGAAKFNQSLCSRGSLIPADANVTSMFASSSCITQDDPDLTAVPPGPFCHPCS